ncbi:MAG: hypothetical protein AAF492_31820, partial [Verrucomicrobiota bacterium]
EENADSQEKGRLRGEISKFLLENTTFDIPASQVDQETQSIIYDIVNQNTRRGVDKSEIENSKEEIYQVANQNAKDRVKMGYILDRIGQEEKFEAGAGEVNNYIRMMASRYGMQELDFRKALEERDGIDEIKSEIEHAKTMDFLLEQAEIKR